jgi:hypothetical protein
VRVALIEITAPEALIVIQHCDNARDYYPFASWPPLMWTEIPVRDKTSLISEPSDFDVPDGDNA